MFHSARLKLTAWYLLIIMLISITFSIVIYRVLLNEVDRFEKTQRFRIERRLRENEIFFQQRFQEHPEPLFSLANPELVTETKHRILITLFLINSSILILSGGLGYMLAGRTLQPIQEMVDEQKRFISDSSHELRTPLTVLKSSLEVNLRDKNLTLKNAKKLIAENITEVNKLQALSDELLQLAQYQKPNNDIKIEKLSIAFITKSAIKKILPLAKKKKISIQYESDDLKIEGNKQGLEDLLVILLDNAIKYSPEKSPVIVKTKKTDGSVKISVEDKGIGIEKADIPHIFDRFYRADTSRSKIHADGYGLGLSIAKKIVSIHHGSVEVKSTPKKGSTFIVHLPLKQPGKLNKPPFFS